MQTLYMAIQREVLKESIAHSVHNGGLECSTCIRIKYKNFNPCCLQQFWIEQTFIFEIKLFIQDEHITLIIIIIIIIIIKNVLI